MKLNAFKKYLKNTSWMMVEQVVRLGMLMVVGIFVARHLGKEGFGFYSYVLSYVGIFTYVSTLGLKNIVQRDLVLIDKPDLEYMGSAFLLHIIGGFISVMIIATSFIFYKQETEAILYILAYSLSLFFNSFQVIEYYFHAKVLAKYTVYSRLIAAFISNGLKVYFIYTNKGVEWFLLATASELIVISMAFILLSKLKQLRISKWKFSRTIAIQLFKESRFLVVSAVIAAIYMKIDQLMIRNMLSDEANGIYSAAVRLSESWYFIPIVISNSLMTALVYARNNEMRLYHKRLQQMHDMFAWMAIPIAVLFSFFSSWVILTLYGSEFSEAGPVLSVHIWAAVFMFLGVASDKWLVIDKEYNVLLYRTLMGTVSNIILNIFLIPAYGIIGAAYATLISYTIASYLSHAVIKKTRFIFIMQTRALFAPIIHFKKLTKIVNWGKSNLKD